jgi:two-component system, NarL family, response regulator LiaR
VALSYHPPTVAEGVIKTPEFGAAHPTRVMLVDDHPIIRTGVGLALRECLDIKVVAEAGSGEAALQLLERVRPDVILMDLEMPGMGGIRAIRAIHDLAPDAKIVVLTFLEDGDKVQQALRAGAIGYQLKNIKVDELISAVLSADSGVVSIAPEAALTLARTTSAGRKLGDDLTEREREVLVLLTEGLPNPAIARELVVSVATVKFHLRSIRSKLGTKTRTATVAVALQHRLVPVG